MDIILASRSPRRRALLEQVGLKGFKVVSPDVDEHIEGNPSPAHLVEALSQRKAQAVLAGADEEKSHRAAVTLHIIRETDLFEMISAQVENKRLIDELMDRYVDEEGNALPVKKERNRGKPVVDWRKLV